MPEPASLAIAQIGEVHRQLIKAAVFGKQLTPDQLERMAELLAQGLRNLDVTPGSTHA
ncbi:DUF6374 family protein [Nocardia crassostreae]|uniref:DUF6374 family protein n=1 Tax=Nocardia crassostreae TaxID=53428 RepID=UPI000A948870|nr:DUF6374 family protein [Nocardia crassostreae]